MQDVKPIYSKYKASVNMSYAELIRWSNSPCSRKASLDRSPITRNLRLLSKPSSDWNSRDIADANRTISFIARMKRVKQGRIIKECGLSKRDISLKNWAYDPKKK